MKNIRNFCIIAHIDHGKSTLADRFIQTCGGLCEREMKAQVLDTMDIERERGITIKAQSVRLYYTAKDGQEYQLNLIDTPGHVDFAYEVSRSLAACEGALLVVDAAQGVEAQTVATCYTALDLNVEVLPVLNKIDLPQAEPAKCCQEIEDMIGIDATDTKEISAKSGLGVKEILDHLVTQIPGPVGEPNDPLQALIMDSWFDNYLGVISLVRVKNGSIKKGDKVIMCATGRQHTIEELGVFTPKRKPLDALECGEVGYIIANIKDISQASVGDTITHSKNRAPALAGFHKVQPKVFAGLFPIASDDYQNLRESLGKLKLNDAAVFYEPENSSALGFGFRCGFLGLLHMEIVKERLEREYNLDLIITAPTVIFEISQKNGERMMIDSAVKLPDPAQIEQFYEPICEATIYLPEEYLGQIMTLCQECRGIQQNINYMTNQVALTYHLPMLEIVLDFYDRLKSVSRGYASLDYHFIEHRAADLVKLDVLIGGERVDALSNIVHKDAALVRGRQLVENLQKLIPRQMFDVAIQAAIGAHIIARSTVKALRKNVTAKCYGGDVSRKKKLLEKQKAGKKRMKSIGKVEIPQEAFLAVLQRDKEKK